MIPAARTSHSPAITVAYRPDASGTLSDEHAADDVPVILTARPFRDAHLSLLNALQDAHYTLHISDTWEHLLHDTEYLAADIVLVDLDAPAPVRTDRRLTLSGHRLVTLLSRQFAGQSTALVILTRLDYAEIEDIARGGIAALLSADLADEFCLTEIASALTRTRRRAQGTSRSKAHRQLAIADITYALPSADIVSVTPEA